jgi:hypothetical protein
MKAGQAALVHGQPQCFLHATGSVTVCNIAEVKLRRKDEAAFVSSQASLCVSRACLDKSSSRFFDCTHSKYKPFHLSRFI